MSTLSVQQVFDLAVQHHQAGNLREAEIIYRQILSQHPQHAEATNNLGAIAQHMGRSDLAADLFRRATALRPDFADAHNNLGEALRSLGQLDAAVVACQKAITLKPQNAGAYFNLGLALQEKGESKGAIAALNQSVALNPDSAKAYFILGNALYSEGNVPEAASAHQQAVRLNPGWVEAQNNLGVEMQAMGRYDEAVSAYRAAIALDPNRPGAYRNLGNTLRALGQIEEAIALMRQGFALEPQSAEAHSNLILTMLYDPNLDGMTIADELRRWDLLHAKPLQHFITPHINDRDPDRPLRIGYVSPDFRRHVVARFLLPLLMHHDRARFDVFCYSNVPNPDETTAHLRSLSAHWRDISRQTDEQTARQIRHDSIDILIDLAGHTGGSRLLLFARKPAPVQVSYLGYPSPTGLSTIDYRLSDALSDPAPTDAVFHLPKTNWCFIEPRNSPSVDPPPMIANGWVTFGSFNKLPKVTGTTLELWARILRGSPNSRLILKAGGFSALSAQERIAQRFASLGIDSARLIFHPRKDSDEDHLKMYSQMDIALDTFPYNGTGTACDALWMGVPVVTLAGQAHVSRVGLSLLTNAGLTELIAATPDQYVQIALDLAKDHDRLFSLRQGIRARLAASPLMDAASFARDVESAYREMWRTWCASGSSLL